MTKTTKNEVITGSKRLVYCEIKKVPAIITFRVSTGERGWLWYMGDETPGDDWKHAVIIGLHTIQSTYTKGVQLFVGPCNLTVAWPRKGA